MRGGIIDKAFNTSLARNYLENSKFDLSFLAKGSFALVFSLHITEPPNPREYPPLTSNQIPLTTFIVKVVFLNFLDVRDSLIKDAEGYDDDDKMREYMWSYEAKYQDTSLEDVQSEVHKQRVSNAKLRKIINVPISPDVVFFSAQEGKVPYSSFELKILHELKNHKFTDELLSRLRVAFIVMEAVANDDGTPAKPLSDFTESKSDLALLSELYKKARYSLVLLAKFANFVMCDFHEGNFLVYFKGGTYYISLIDYGFMKQIGKEDAFLSDVEILKKWYSPDSYSRVLCNGRFQGQFQKVQWVVEPNGRDIVSTDIAGEKSTVFGARRLIKFETNSPPSSGSEIVPAAKSPTIEVGLKDATTKPFLKSFSNYFPKTKMPSLNMFNLFSRRGGSNGRLTRGRTPKGSARVRKETRRASGSCGKQSRSSNPRWRRRLSSSNRFLGRARTSTPRKLHK